MNVERMEPIKPSPRCIDNLRSDLKEYQVDPKLAQKMEEFKIAILTIDPGRDSPRTGIRSAKVQHVCVTIFSCQPRSVRLFNGCALVKKMLQKLPCINRLLKEPEVFLTEYVKKSMMHDVDSHSAYYVRQKYVDQKCLPHLASAMLTCYATCPKRGIIVISADVRYFCKM